MIWVMIGGVLLTDVLSPEWSFVFQCLLIVLVCVLNLVLVVVVYGVYVVIDVGWNGFMVCCFIGMVFNINLDELGCVIECQGKFGVLENIFYEVIVSVDGMKMVMQFVQELLVAAGFMDYLVDLFVWMLGIVCFQDFIFQIYGEVIMKVVDLCVVGGQWWEMFSGQVCVVALGPAFLVIVLVCWVVECFGLLIGDFFCVFSCVGEGFCDFMCQFVVFEVLE